MTYKSTLWSGYIMVIDKVLYYNIRAEPTTTNHTFHESYKAKYYLIAVMSFQSNTAYGH